MAKRVRKKTKTELADPTFRKRVSSQSEVLLRAYAECEKLSKSRLQFIYDLAEGAWVNRFVNLDDDVAFEKESRRWAKLRREFVNTVEKPREIHCFTCLYSADQGIKPLIRMMKHPSCDAGTALRLFWIYDPAYYSDYRTISECPDDEEQDVMRLLRTIKRRFKQNDFKTNKIYFDPEPWIEAGDLDLEALQLPDSMLAAVPWSPPDNR
ncbi:MAG: DUF4274 domain-containing protein [Planctomycetes bacterium]|nr:DUF4274 domain-containing protein [Planctomycetota bacterium]MCH9727698.1 DUF4274 domain-containing protein [Planctomycetota bacterium]MCH9776977.1 DUF4274 domain-containing protein [Planctomycetota bacterium]MCH9792429.1 DUF4274 domain-containing protein [Planctomycetota bacterium]